MMDSDAEATPNRAVVDRWVDAMSRSDLSAFDEIIAPDVVEDYPQSGERFRGRENLRAMLQAFPGIGEALQPDIRRVVGGDETWLLTPRYSVVRVAGRGDEFTIIGTITYPGGDTWQFVQIVGVTDGKIARITSYFAEPFEPAEWRAPYREAPR